jgi:antirestriction protein
MEYDTQMADMDVTIEYNYIPGDEDNWSDSNGDPGTPGVSDSVEIIAVYKNLLDKHNKTHAVDILSIIESYCDIDYQKEEILKHHER